MVIHWVPIGYECTAAGGLKAIGVRTAAYPFDWLVTPAEGLLDCLREDFARFLTDPVCITQYREMSAVRDAYGFEFRHDFPTVDGSGDDEWRHENTLVPDWMDHMPEVKAKFARRIQRFRDALASGEPTVLVRRGGTEGMSFCEEVLRILRGRYPGCNVRLLIANGLDLHPTPDILTVRIDDANVWNNPDDWREAVNRVKHDLSGV